MSTSPYSGNPGPAWLATTRRLIASHPLPVTELRDTCLVVWERLWRTTIGEPPHAIPLGVLDVPATVVGYFFEVLLAHELAARHPTTWRGNASKGEKDLVCMTKPEMSFEIKTSGQLGYKVYGNRSHGQKSDPETAVKKEKSGYYATVNFFGSILTLVRFGWLDATDWIPQQSQTGQMAGLGSEVYDYKLIPVPGSYRACGPVRLLRNVGERTDAMLNDLGIDTIGDLLAAGTSLGSVAEKILSSNHDFLVGCVDIPPG